MDPITLSLILGLGGYIGARVLGGIAESATGSEGFGKFCKYTADIGLFVYMTVTLAGVPLVGAASSKILEWLAPAAVTSLWSVGKFVGATAIGGCLASIIKWKSGDTSEEAGNGLGDAISGLYHKVKDKIQHKLDDHKQEKHADKDGVHHDNKKLEQLTSEDKDEDSHKPEKAAVKDGVHHNNKKLEKLTSKDEDSHKSEKENVKDNLKQAPINLKASGKSDDSNDDGYDSGDNQQSEPNKPLQNKQKNQVTEANEKEDTDFVSMSDGQKDSSVELEGDNGQAPENG